jgi:hypothetical protein
VTASLAALFLLPLGPLAAIPPPAPEMAYAAVANAEPLVRAPVGYTWSVPLFDGTVEVSAPVAVVETVLPLPITVQNHTSRAVRVVVCESHECILPKNVDVNAGDAVDVDALFAGRGPRLQFYSFDGRSPAGEPRPESRRDCCDRNAPMGRVVAFAGPAEREFAFASHADSVGGVSYLPINVGTFLQQRPDVVDGFAAVVFDDGYAPASLCAPVQRFLRQGGVVSLAQSDVAALAEQGCVFDVSGAAPIGYGRVDGMNMVRLAKQQVANVDAVIAPVDGIAVRVEDRAVRLEFVDDNAVAVGAGTLVLRGAPRSEATRLAQVLLADDSLKAGHNMLDPRNDLVVKAASAGLAPTTHGALAFGVVVLCLIGVGVAFFGGLKHGPGRAATRALWVSLVGVAAVVGLRVAVRDSRAVAVERWAAGDGARRVVQAYARAASSFGVVDLAHAPFAGEPTVAVLVGDAAWRSRAERKDGRVQARVSSSSGLVGLWYSADATPGALRLVQANGGWQVKNDFAFAIDTVVIRDVDEPHVVGARPNWVLHNLAPGASANFGDAVDVDDFGTVVEQRIATELMGQCSQRGCAVGVTTRNGVTTAIEVTR